MRWLIIGFLVSLGLLLFAAGGMAWHILFQRAHPNRKPPASSNTPSGPVEGTDIEIES
jgi:hypothetical protein